MTTNELMRHLLTDISEDDQRHLIEVVDRNHAEQLARKRRAPIETEAEALGHTAGGFDDFGDAGSEPWDDDTI